MSKEFVREERYIVFKLSDVERYLTDKDRANITMMKMEIDAGRDCANKPPFKGLIVEADWPEYEPTWKAIEARVHGAQPAPSMPETWLEQGLKELDAIRQNSDRDDDWHPNDENIVRRLYQAMVAYGVQQAPSVPYGWKLVPIEPTEEMMMRDSSCQKHAHDDQICVHRTNRRWIWETMLAAAPEAKP